MTAPCPDPEALRARRDPESPRPGRLKVFFGASPGVGKTDAMLEAARRKKREGVTVVCGWVETHGRGETAALLHDLETIPPRPVECRGVTRREFDIDAALRRRPELLLLDELARSNAPGSRHAKRWQDARELLDTGIDVWTTLNVQHLDSLNDVVARITGVAVRETVPDRLLDEADEVEFVDLPTDELLRRLREGRLDVPEQAGQPLRSLLHKGNLIALRELAFRRTAERVDEDVRGYRRAHAIQETWPVTERLLVCIRPNPESGGLVRAGRRLAGRLHADFIVAYVESPSQPALSDGEKRELAASFKLADQLGADTAVLSGHSVGEAVLSYARTHNVSKIVVGKPARPRWRERLFGSPVEAIVRGSGEIDVYVMAGERTLSEPRPPWPRSGVAPAHFAWAAAISMAATLACSVLFPHFDRANLIMVYLVGVAFVAVRFGRWPSVFAACLSVAAFNFFFVAPYLTFAVADPQYLVTFAVMLAVAILISELAVRLRDQAEASRQRERRTHELYATSRELASLTDADAVRRAATRLVAAAFQGQAVIFFPDTAGVLGVSSSDHPSFAEDQKDRAVAEWVFRHGRLAGLGTDTLPDASALHVPLTAGRGPLGVLAVQPHSSLLPLSVDHRDLLETLARLVAASLERARLAAAAESARVDMEAERLRNALLSSVSHDLRTPLAAITGAATSLLEQSAFGSGPQRDLVETVQEEAFRLNQVVTNLLDMTRLESGALHLKREWHSMEELVGGALARAERALAPRQVRTRIPVDLPLVPIDALLVERVLVNLLENAARHTPAGTAVMVAAAAEDGALQVEVSDDGPGLAAGDEERVFERFFRKAAKRETGFGLGLSICRAIVKAHGGRIWAENLRPRGAAFRFMLPIEGTPPDPPAMEGPDERTP